MADAHANFAYSTVATAPSPATSGTSLVVASGDGALFPAVPFNAVICPVGAQPTAANAEIVRATARSTDTLTITRAQESSTARTVIVGDQIFAAVTAKTLTDIEPGALYAPQYKVLTSDLGNVTATTTLADVTGLSFAIPGSGTNMYWVEVMLLVSVSAGGSGPSTADLKLDWTKPASAGVQWGSRNNADTSRSGWSSQSTGGSPAAIGNSGTPLTFGFPTAGNIIGMEFAALVKDTGSSGTIQLQSAQNVSDASGYIIKAGSFLRITRLS